MVDAARESERLIAGGLDVDPVDADRRRSDESLSRRLSARVDLAKGDRARIEPEVGHRGAQVGESARMRGAAVPEQELYVHATKASGPF